MKFKSDGTLRHPRQAEDVAKELAERLTVNTQDLGKSGRNDDCI